jgi:hypothetical protein
MSSHELRILLDDVPDTLELVLRREPLRPLEMEAWRDAGDEALHAFAAWCENPGDRRAYAVYRAAQDREDAAQDALSGSYSQTSRSSVS